MGYGATTPIVKTRLLHRSPSLLRSTAGRSKPLNRRNVSHTSRSSIAGSAAKLASIPPRVRLLLDQNLSPRLVRALAECSP